MRVGPASPRAHLLLLLAAAALGAAPAIASGCGSSATQAASAATGSGGSTTKGMDTGGATASSTAGTGGHGTTASSGTTGSTGTGGAGGDGGLSTGGTGGSIAVVDAGDAGGPVTTVLSPGEAPLPGESVCQVVEVTNIPEPDFTHITPCTPITYPSPPSGGNHWPIWGAYAIYTEPLPREMYVHDLEHGAIVLTYKCAGSCPDVVAALTQVFDSMVDPLCETLSQGVLARMVLTPDPLLDTPIAASAWGNTYTATCIDIPSLQAFANAHYGQGREVLCDNGQNNQSDPLCPDGGS